MSEQNKQFNLQLLGLTLTGIIGYPIEHTLSPQLHNAAFQALNLNWLYLPFSVKPEAVKEAVFGFKALNFAGFNVTLPHKQAVAELVDALSPEAELAGAVNTVKINEGKLVGYNTDIGGFLASLKEIGLQPAGKTALLIGAGGAGLAVAVALAQAQIKKVVILNRTVKKAENLRRKLSNLAIEALCLADFKEAVDLREEIELVVNATSVGMAANPGLPVPVELITEKQLVYDLIYTPVETELIKLAKSKGCRTLNGLSMLVHQGALAFQIWTEKPAPIETMKKAVGLNASN